MIKSFGRKVLTPLLGRRRLQPLFESLYEIALAGLNFGEGKDPRLSGEQFVIRLVAERLRDLEGPAVIFDVGANIGVYTGELLDVLGDSASIWAFEPAPSTFRMLEANVGGRENVTVRNIGFSDGERAATLYSPGAGSKLGSVYDISARLARLGTSVALNEPITLKTMDRFCEEEQIEWIDLIKLDVEGHELKVLEGAPELLSKGRIDVIQFEFSAANLESRTYFRDFFQLLNDRYLLYRVLQSGLYPLDRYRESYEVFKGATNYLALRRGTE